MADSLGHLVGERLVALVGAGVAVMLALLVPAGSAFGSPLDQSSEFATPTASSGPLIIAVGRDGNLWFTEYSASRIGEINPTTHQTSDFATPTPSSGPEGIAVGPDGNLWFTENSASRIGEINPTTHQTSDFATPTASSGPSGVAAGPDGNLWFAENSANRIGEINPTTHATSDYPTPTGISHPVGIAAGPDGNLWFAEVNGGQIGEINPVTHIITEPVSFGGADGIAVGPDGNLWIAEGGSREIGQVNPDTQANVELDAPVGYGSASGIAAGPDGNVWFADFGASKIGEIGTGAPAASIAAPAVTGSGQQGTQQVCQGDRWSDWAGQQPLVSEYGFDGYRWLRDGTAIAGASSQAYVPVAGDVGHQLTCAVTVTYALLQTTTSATGAPVTVIPQSSGPTGAAGQSGPSGPPGATGPQGPSGQVELVTCKTVKTTVTRKHKKVHVTKQVCATKLVSGPVTFTGTSADLRASLSRAGAIYATGYARRTRGRLQTSLLAARRLARGRYTLTLTTRHGQRQTSTRQQVAIR